MSDLVQQILCQILFISMCKKIPNLYANLILHLDKLLSRLTQSDIDSFDFIQILVNSTNLKSAVDIAFDDIVFELSNKENGDDNDYIYF